MNNIFTQGMISKAVGDDTGDIVHITNMIDRFRPNLDEDEYIMCQNIMSKQWIDPKHYYILCATNKNIWYSSFDINDIVNDEYHECGYPIFIYYKTITPEFLDIIKCIFPYVRDLFVFHQIIDMFYCRQSNPESKYIQPDNYDLFITKLSENKYQFRTNIIDTDNEYIIMIFNIFADDLGLLSYYLSNKGTLIDNNNNLVYSYKSSNFTDLPNACIELLSYLKDDIDSIEPVVRIIKMFESYSIKWFGLDEN